MEGEVCLRRPQAMNTIITLLVPTLSTFKSSEVMLILISRYQVHNKIMKVPILLISELACFFHTLKRERHPKRRNQYIPSMWPRTLRTTPIVPRTTLSHQSTNTSVSSSFFRRIKQLNIIKARLQPQDIRYSLETCLSCV